MSWICLYLILFLTSNLRITQTSFIFSTRGFTKTQNCQYCHQRLPLWKQKKISNKILPQVETESGTAAIQVWCSPFWATLAFAYKSATLDPALLILTKSSKPGNQVVYEHNRTSTYHVSSEREHQTYMAGSIPTGEIILLLILFCFHVVQPILPISANLL